MSTDASTRHAINILPLQPGLPASKPYDSDSKQDVEPKLEVPGASIVSAVSSSSENEIDESDDYVPTEAEDRAVRRKLDCLVMPMLFLGFYVFQVRRKVVWRSPGKGLGEQGTI
jgi:hypothetical protein